MQAWCFEDNVEGCQASVVVVSVVAVNHPQTAYAGLQKSLQ